MRNSPLGSPIESKLQVVELSLLPPTSRGIMPAGIQRFPFEFPIPSTLPTTIHIPKRIEIFYQLSATIRCSSGLAKNKGASAGIWIDRARLGGPKRKYTACSPMRIVRAMESIVSNGLPINNRRQADTSSSPVTPIVSTLASSMSSSITEESPIQLPWNRRGLSDYQGTLDEQHDQLAFSLSGRTIGNLNSSTAVLENVQGIRYKFSIDRTAIALGTSIGIELLIEPTLYDTFIKSVCLKISENRKYLMKVPSNHTWTTISPEIKTQKEGATMLLKWAYSYEVDGDYEDNAGLTKKKSSDKYVHQRSSKNKFLSYFDPSQPGNSENKLLSDNGSDIKNDIFLDSKKQIKDNSSPFTSQLAKDNDMINLKALNQEVIVGNFFGGRFVMPVPDCSNILHPSMEYESISISHWFQLVVTMECNGKTFDLQLESPGRVLDCRLVSVDDECQTILPPPPSYQPGDDHLFHGKNWSPSTFWEQREAITNDSCWGSCMPCPCQYKKMKRDDEKSNCVGNKNRSKLKTRVNSTGTFPSNLLPEWGPPPLYSENQ